MKKIMFIMAVLCFGMIGSAQAITVDLVAGQDMVVGTVEVTWDDGDICVEYILDTGCEDVLLTETHLHVGTDIDDFPLTGGKKKNPKIGKFDYSREYDPGVSSDMYIIEAENLPEGEPPYMIAAHAVTGTEYCSADEVPSTLTGQVFWPWPPNDPIFTPVASYFQFTISGDGALNGDYDAWCADIDLSATYDEVSYTVIAGVPAEINCLLNNNYVGEIADDGEEFTVGDVQVAIWILTKPALEDLDDLKTMYEGYAETLLSWFGPSGTGDDEASQAAHVAQILEEVADCTLVPGCCQVMGVLLYPPLADPPNQPILIAIPAPCCETAWGDGEEGERFSDGDGNWATWFWFPAAPVLTP